MVYRQIDSHSRNCAALNLTAIKIELVNEAATAALARRFGAQISSSIGLATQANTRFIPLLVYLHGDLGAGKTFFVRSLLHSLGFCGRVKSPTFTLMESYAIAQPSGATVHAYHFDFYRFEGGSDWREAGFEEVLPGDGLALVEWPEKAAGLPLADIEITFTLGAIESERTATLQSHTGRGQQLLSSIDLAAADLTANR